MKPTEWYHDGTGETPLTCPICAENTEWSACQDIDAPDVVWITCNSCLAQFRNKSTYVAQWEVVTQEASK